MGEKRLILSCYLWYLRFLKKKYLVCHSQWCETDQQSYHYQLYFLENSANDIGDVFRIINGTPTISYSLVDKSDYNDLYNGNGGILNCGAGMVYNEDPPFFNGNAFGGNIESFNIDALNGGDIFTCEVVSSASCVSNSVAFSNAVTIHVENMATAALSITPDELVPCEGQMVTFSASPENGGSSPSFQWSVNELSVGNNSPFFEYIPPAR